jgi:hypothetical protein
MEKKTGSAPFPDDVMADVAWTFTGQPFRTQAEFESALKEYQADIKDDTSWDPSELVLLAPRVVVRHEEGEDEEDCEVTLNANDGKVFSAGELLFKVHNAFVNQLDGLDHHFFEGFSLEADESKKFPVYVISMGS